MSSERDQQELIAKKEARKEYALRRKLVAQSMRQADVSGKDIKGQLKAMDRTIKEGAAEEKKYIEAMDCIRETYGTLETLCETVDTEELPVIKQRIDVVKADLKRAGKVYYADVENVWYQAMERFGDASEVFLQPGRIRPAKDPRAEDLRQAATGLLERVRSVIPEEGPDFYEKTKETPGLLRNIGKGIEANDIEYASRKQAVIHKIDLLSLVLIALIDDHDSVGKFFQQDKVLPHHIRDQRALDLYDNLRSVEERRFVHLADGRRAERIVVKVLEGLFDLLARFLLYHGAHHVAVKRLDVLAQLFQFLAVALRKHVDTAGHDLTDLDIGRAEVLQRCAQFHRREAARIEIVLRKDAEHLRRARLFTVLHVADIF